MSFRRPTGLTGEASHSGWWNLETSDAEADYGYEGVRRWQS
jgi:hypothetical protein